jgi:hypothetical protein
MQYIRAKIHIQLFLVHIFSKGQDHLEDFVRGFIPVAVGGGNYSKCCEQELSFLCSGVYLANRCHRAKIRKYPHL